MGHSFWLLSSVWLTTPRAESLVESGKSPLERIRRPKVREATQLQFRALAIGAMSAGCCAQWSCFGVTDVAGSTFQEPVWLLLRAHCRRFVAMPAGPTAA